MESMEAPCWQLMAADATEQSGGALLHCRFRGLFVEDDPAKRSKPLQTTRPPYHPNLLHSNSSFLGPLTQLHPRVDRQEHHLGVLRGYA